MKVYLITVVFIIGISSTQCRLLEGLFGTIKNTTNAIKYDITDAVNFGKNAIFGDNKAKSDNEGKQLGNTGLIDKISLKIHDLAVDAREHFRSAIAVFAIDENGKGPIGRIFDRMKTHIIDLKRFLPENLHKQKGICAVNNNTNILCDKLKDYVYKNKTSSDTGVRKTIYSLKEIADKVRNNITKYKQNNEETDGTGLIDIRLAQGNVLEQDNINIIDNGVKTAYNKVEGLN